METTRESSGGEKQVSASSSSSAPPISVVIPTRDRRELLQRTLESLERQRGVSGLFEVIVADDGSSDGTAEYLRSLEPSGSFLFRSFHLAGTGPATARNRAIALATAPRVLLLGDDTFPSDDLLARHLAESGQHELAIQGRIEWDPGGEITPVMRFLAPEGPQFYFKGLSDGQQIPYTLLYASNFSAPRRWFLQEPFDESFRNAAFEDTELAFRWRRRGHVVIYSERALCWHRHHYDSIDSFLPKQVFAGRGARHAVRLHPAMAIRTVFQPAVVGLLHGMRYAIRRLRRTARDEDAWDLLCRAAFFRGFLSRVGRTGPRRSSHR